MVKRILILLSVVFILGSCKNETNNDQKESDSTNITTVELKNFDTEASKFVDQQIKITGIVDHVCKHGGKKVVLVNQDGTASVHVESEISFSDTLIGSELTLVGIVREFRVDEAYCQQLEDDAMTQHSDGDDADAQQSKKMEEAQFYRDSMKTAGVDHLSFYSLEFVSFE